MVKSIFLHYEKVCWTGLRCFTSKLMFNFFRYNFIKKKINIGAISDVGRALKGLLTTPTAEID